MKHLGIIIGIIALVTIGVLAFAMPNKNPGNPDNPKTPKNNYENMWKNVKENLEKNLPESAEKELNAIEEKATKDKNQTQLLKVWLYRQNIMRITVEEDPEQAFIQYVETKIGQLDAVHDALLHEEIAKAYAEYLDGNEWRINDNLPIDGDISKVEMKYWDKESFKTRINQHYDEALKPVEALKNAKTEDFMVLFENKNNNEENIEYEASLFEFMFHRVAKYYQEQADADDVEGETDAWWLPAKDFVKADLGTADNPLTKCLKIYQDLIAFNLKSSNEDVLIYNDFKRFGFVNGILDKDAQYQAAMEDLKAQHKDNPLSAEITSLIARSMMNQYESNSSDSAYFDHYKKAKAMCEEAIAKFPKSKGAKNCQNLIERIEEPQIDITLNSVQLPNEAIPAVLEYKNTTAPYYRIVKVSEKELKKLNELYGEDRFKELSKMKALLEQELTLAAETDYRNHSTLIALPALECGFYFLMATTEKGIKSRDKTLVLQFQVSSLGFITDEKDHKMTLVVVDRKTGKTVEGVTVELYRREFDYKDRQYKTIILETPKTDSNGRVQLSKKTNNSFCINLRKGDDNLLSEQSFYLSEKYGNRAQDITTKLFTDRAIYRPGQTVYFQGITTRRQGEDLTLVNNYSETVSFRDANWQEITSANFSTDEYGSFSGSFVIPTDRLNGVFHLNAKQGSVNIRVEEYKRPTFEVTFERPKEQYKLNQEVTVHGDVKAYAGFGLDDVEYSYRVIRKTSFPWRCWWWWYPTVEDEQITYGKACTDENGKFAVTFRLKPSKTIAPEKQPMFTYEIEVTATSKQGETHADTYSIRAGYNEIAIGTDLPSKVEKSDIGKYQITVSNLSWQPAKSRISRKIYRYEDAAKIDYFKAMGLSAKLDRQMLSDAELERLFPMYSFYDKNQVPEPVEGPAHLVDESEIMVDDKAKFYEGKALEPGRYVVDLTSLDDPLAKTSQQFTVFENDSKKLPVTTMEWKHLDKSTAHPGDEIHFSIGSSAKDVDIWVQLLHGDEVRLDKKINLSNGVQTLSYKVTESDRGGLAWRYAFVKENSYNTDRLSVSVPFDNYDLDVKLATMRDKLSPGAEETWEVTVRDYKDKPLEAALLAGMYDASLDEFERNYWGFSMSPSGVYGNSFGTDDHGFTSSNTGLEYFYFAELFNFSLPSDAPFFDFGYGFGRRMYKGLGAGRVMYDEMVMEEAIMPMSSPVLSKKSVEANGAIETADAEEMVEIKKQESVAPKLDKGEEKKEPAEPTLRENFNETAFFFPQLRTNTDGSATFSFTMPDALTRWRLMLMAYTKDRKTGSKDYTFTSSKPVMIMADMPRYMYDNDELWFVANVINTGDEPVTPKAKLEIFDAGTMKPVNMIVMDGPSTLRQAQGSGAYTIPMETIQPGRSKEVRWKVKGQYDLSLLAFRFTAYAGEFSDAEQHLLPVLSSEIFMTQTLPITVKAETEKTFDVPLGSLIAGEDPQSLPGDSHNHERDYSLTLNFSTNPVWYAVQALPYLANVKTDRAETAFYVFYANTLSSYIADNIPNLLNYIKKWQIETPDALLSQLEKDQDLKAIMLQETPWVLEAKSETEQRNRIATLFEVNTIRNQQTNALRLIKDKQKYNGGWPWMDGMPESPYISTYILSGFGKLQKMGAWSSLSKTDQNTAQSICDKAVRYLEYEVAETYRNMKRYSKGKDWPIGSSTLNELYALSFFKEQNSDKDFAKAKDYYLKSLDKEWTSFNFNQRSMGALVLYRNGNEKTAKLMIQSFKECAQKNEQIGMYWPKKYFSFESHIATHANIMAAFAEIDQDQEMIDELRVWLLTQKQTTMWENSASTADAIYALLMRGSDWFDEGKEVTLRFSNTPISTEGGVAGTGFIQRRWNASEVTQDMRQLTVNNPTPHLVWGGLFRQYFVPIDEVKSDESGFTIKRELFVETVTDKGKKLVPVGYKVPEPVEGPTLQVGDKLTVKITFTSQQDMSFVFVKDLRAAGFEPIEQISRYEYNDQMCYYQSNTDTDMEFFIEFLPKGTHQLEYSMFVTKEGYLNNGYALIQCQYAPEFSAYSDGMRVKVGE